ncbi:hypothetical protein [Streptomyces sp. NPDC020141]|uniref:hypothetical protein n=1 Tax=Streptomyces sp. NPDC020141 TaxID=3365065 RepID=UPI003789C69E
MRERHAMAAVLTAAVLLTGCGGSGDGERKEQDGGRSPAAALTPAEVKAVLPRTGDVPGWKPADSMVLDMSKGASAGACAGGKQGECARARAIGSIVLRKAGEGELDFRVFAHRDAETATEAYPFLWKDASESWITPAEKVSIGTPGDRRDALRGELETGYGSHVQIRVGPTLLLLRVITPDGRPHRTDAQLRALGEMFAERAREAHDGELPSAVLRG